MSLIISTSGRPGKAKTLRNAYIVLSLGQSNEGQAVFPYALDSYPVFPLPSSPVDFNAIDPQIKFAIDTARPDIPFTLRKAHTGVFRWESSEGAYWSSGDGIAAYGWEQTFLRRLKNRVNDTVYFVRVAKSGIGIEYFQSGGGGYDLLASGLTFAIEDIIAAGKRPVILFCDYGHGENAQADTGYRPKIIGVVDYIRQIYPPYTTNIPFMLRKMSVVQTLFSRTLVNAAMDGAALDRPGLYPYAPDDMTSPAITGYIEPNYSGVAHYDDAGQYALGDYLYDLTDGYGILP